MKTQRLIPHFLGLMLIGVALLSIGCKGPGKSKAHTVSVSLDPSLQGQRVLVDLVPVNPSQKRQWEEKSMTEYWGSADALRTSARKVTMEFSEPEKPQIFTAKDQMWKEWLAIGATEVFVLADLPNMGRADDKPGEADARRRILPLDTKRWARGTDELRVQVNRGGLEVISRQRPR